MQPTPILLCALACLVTLVPPHASSARPVAVQSSDSVQSSDRAGSQGCGRSLVETGATLFVIQYDGRQRTYEIYVPASYDPDTPTPLVLNLHSLLLGGPQRASYTHISQQRPKAEQAGYISVEPDGTGFPASWNGGAHCCDPAHSEGVDDVAFIHEVVRQVMSRLCIDRRRIYATGMSNGAYLSHRLACEQPAKIAAIAPVVGSISPELQCANGRAVPVLQISGTEDNLASRQQSVDTWRGLNECGEATSVFQEGDLTCTTHTDCRDGVDVSHCVIANGGHCTFTDADPTFPASCVPRETNPAQDLIWDFVSRWQLPEPIPEPSAPTLALVAVASVAGLRLAARRRSGGSRGSMRRSARTCPRDRAGTRP